MIIDTHTHPEVHPSQRMAETGHSAADYRALAEPLGIEKAAALVMAPGGDPDLTRTLNDAVLELGASSGDFYFPVCSVHPYDGDAAFRELERVRAGGSRWIKLHPNTQNFDVADPRIAEVVGKASELDMPVLFDAYSPWDVNQPGKFVKLAMAVPKARLILAHAHGPQFPALLMHDVLARYSWWDRRIWIDISATAAMLANGPFAEQFVWILRKVGTDRVLFGSDYPLDTPAAAVAGVRSLGFTDDELKAIFCDNARDLLSSNRTSK